mgnify:CR=1 FL=1
MSFDPEVCLRQQRPEHGVQSFESWPQGNEHTFYLVSIPTPSISISFYFHSSPVVQRHILRCLELIRQKCPVFNHQIFKRRNKAWPFTWFCRTADKKQHTCYCRQQRVDHCDMLKNKFWLSSLSVLIQPGLSSVELRLNLFNALLLYPTVSSTLAACRINRKPMWTAYNICFVYDHSKELLNHLFQTGYCPVSCISNP